jgi:poly(A) polymerase
MHYPETLRTWLSGYPRALPLLYVVGGTVRDLLLGNQPKDIDLVCADAKTFACHIRDEKKAALIPLEKKASEPCYRLVNRGDPDNFLDVAEMRGPAIRDDLAGRDFTINSIAAEVKKNGTLGDLIDPFDGIRDIEHRTIRMTGREAFASDPLRILRAFRFSASLNFCIEPRTREKMVESRELLSSVSGERITAELLLILKIENASSFIRQMDEIGIFDILFPETKAMKGCAQNGFHHKDVWEHSLLAAANCEKILNHLPAYFGDRSVNISENLSADNRLPLLKLAALLHDTGKPATAGLNAETGRITFYGHDKKGENLVKEIAAALKLSCRDRDYLVQLVAEHLHLLGLAGKNVKPATRMKWFRKMKENAIPSIILGMADVESSLGKESTPEWRKTFLEWSKNTVQEYYEMLKERLSSPNLVTGMDLMDLGMAPGPQMGKFLDFLRNAQDTGEIRTREEALRLTGKLLAERRFPG